MRTHDVLMLLGRDHRTFGRIDVATLGGGRSAAAISPGARADAPSMVNKADRRFPNEDALLVVEDAERTLLAVADAHFGHQASHALIEALAAHDDPVPSDPEVLERLVTTAPPRDEHGSGRSRTSLTVCVVDRAAGRGFGVTWGDSSVVTVDGDETVRRTMPFADFVAPEEVSGRRPRSFGFDLEGVRLVAAFTDGIDECHYRSPATSIGPHHVHAIARAADFAPETFVRDLARQALRGVDGNPGGQDNLVVAGTRP